MKMTELQGKRLRKQDFDEGKILFVREEPDLRYARDLGVALGRYLAEYKKGRIIASKCNHCKRVVLPPRVFCEYCFRNMDEWVYLPDTGTIRTFSIMHIDADAERLKEPWVVAWVEIDGTSKDIGILAYIKEISPNDVHFGMRVRAVWRPEQERKGDVTDIEYFKPL